MKVLELFGGIGAIRKAFERQNIPHKVVDYVEIDKYAVASYNAMFNENFEVQDITTWDKDIDVDFIMHGSPCQDFSLAGKQAGGDLGSGTRSSLMYETIRIVGKLRPKYVMWENVKNLLSKNHRHNFDAYIETMNILGYNSYYQVLNAKDYGIPQNRERVYTISIRKDIDKGFEFPQKEELKLKLKDILEDEVDEKYYLSDKMKNYILDNNETQKKVKNLKEQLCDYLIENNMVKENDVIRHSYSTNRMNNFYTQNSDNNNTSPTLDTRCDCLGVCVKNATKKGYIEAYDGDSINLAYPESTTRRGRVGNQVSQTLQCNDSMGVVIKNKRLRETVEKNRDILKENSFIDSYNKKIDNSGITGTITTRVSASNETHIINNLRIRKLTPKECWRLMGFDDEDFNKAEKVNSNSQLYKQAGNSIVVNVLEKILNNLFKEQ